MPIRTPVSYIGVAVLIIAGAGWFLSVQYESSARALTRGESTWGERIRAVGGSAAYQEFALFVASSSRNQQHKVAHEFGAALYHVLGEEGLAVCDSRFSFGCFHEFLGRAIAEKGFAAVPRLNEGCREAMSTNVLACQHGIGHGVLASAGYERVDLLKALAICKDLPYSDTIGGCYGGVFMEYNVRTMLGEEAAPREDEGGAHEPCASLAPDFRYACYYWQPQWWKQGFLEGQELGNTYARMGSFCLEVKEQNDRRACFEGIGNITAQASDFRGAESATLCDAVSSLVQHQTLCRSIAANHLGLDASAAEAEKACQGLFGDYREYCLQYASNRANLAEKIELLGASDI
ncbi:hypothetical protein HY417_01965 [Candidatus Kaiserbacteria bacterium]|nr:hypothetical protein [Candidatus Kaiserbacteria bacterium]